ncbi:MAG: hypothetical protein OEU36_22625, partial [Gammaproteobacteria bacterium]|nr:hypothetical protein [Gammaproteobacteria bacterium]
NTRRTIIDKFGWSKEEFRVKVENVFKPVNVALTRAKVPPQKIIIFDSAFDHCIPKTARDALWKALGQPERYSFLYGHKTSFLSMTPLGFNFMRGKIYEFFGARGTL